MSFMTSLIIYTEQLTFKDSSRRRIYGSNLFAMLFSGDERSQFAYITFEDDEGAERAMLLTVICNGLFFQ